ncbi:short-chain fatty acid transporter [Desulfurella sp.]|uniref:short-chain fatty acid transporter n=1 Tax=Desulfurella sp. TaxID=1962857 RepID=UPI003D12813E
MLGKISNFFVKLMQKYMPDPFLFVIVLTLLSFVMALLLTPTPFIKMVEDWYKGLWAILTFGLQMVLILVTGYTLAETKIIKKFLTFLAGIPKDQANAAVMIFLIAAIASFINWGLGLITGAILAREIAKRVEKADFGYLVASAYIGFIVWAGGLSSSIALVIASKGNPMNIIEQHTHVIVGLSQTVFAWYNLIATVITVIILSFVIYFTQPKKDLKIIDKSILEAQDKELEQAKEVKKDNTFASKLENAWILNVIVFLIGLIYLFKFGFKLDINKFIFIMFLVGLILHWKPIVYVKTFNNAAKVTGPLILQYPLYGGIMGLITGSGLAAVMAGWFVSFSTAHTLPFWSFISSIIISLFIPSGGGHWVVQAPIMVPAAQTLGSSQALTAMGIAYGEQVANMMQPFWALPILAIARLGAKDIMGYCTLALFIGTIIFGSMLIIVG